MVEGQFNQSANFTLEQKKTQLTQSSEIFSHFQEQLEPLIRKSFCHLLSPNLILAHHISNVLSSINQFFYRPEFPTSCKYL